MLSTSCSENPTNAGTYAKFTPLSIFLDSGDLIGGGQGQQKDPLRPVCANQNIAQRVQTESSIDFWHGADCLNNSGGLIGSDVPQGGGVG